MKSASSSSGENEEEEWDENNDVTIESLSPPRPGRPRRPRRVVEESPEELEKRAAEKAKIKAWFNYYAPAFSCDFKSGEACIFCNRGDSDHGTAVPLFYCSECNANPVHGGVCADFLLRGTHSECSEQLDRRLGYHQCGGCKALADDVITPTPAGSLSVHQRGADGAGDVAAGDAQCSFCHLSLIPSLSQEVHASASMLDRRVRQPSIVFFLAGENGANTTAGAGAAHTLCALAARAPISPIGDAVRECEQCAKTQRVDGTVDYAKTIPRQLGLLMCCSEPGCEAHIHPNCARDGNWTILRKVPDEEADRLLLLASASTAASGNPAAAPPPPPLPDESKKIMYLAVRCKDHDLVPKSDSIGVVGASKQKWCYDDGDGDGDGDSDGDGDEPSFLISDEDDEEDEEDDESIQGVFGFDDEATEDNAPEGEAKSTKRSSIKRKQEEATEKKESRKKKSKTDEAEAEPWRDNKKKKTSFIVHDHDDDDDDDGKKYNISRSEDEEESAKEQNGKLLTLVAILPTSWANVDITEVDDTYTIHLLFPLAYSSSSIVHQKPAPPLIFVVVFVISFRFIIIRVPCCD